MTAISNTTVEDDDDDDDRPKVESPGMVDRLENETINKRAKDAADILTGGEGVGASESTSQEE